jgi:hypothetical protein
MPTGRTANGKPSLECQRPAEGRLHGGGDYAVLYLVVCRHCFHPLPTENPLRKLFAVPVIALGAVTLSGSAAFAHECTNASRNAHKPDAGAQVVFASSDEAPPLYVSQGLANRIDRGIVDFESGEGFHGLIAFDEDGDGEVDGSTYIGVGPDGSIPLNAQLNGSPDHGIVNICGPEGCTE